MRFSYDKQDCHKARKAAARHTRCSNDKLRSHSRISPANAARTLRTIRLPMKFAGLSHGLICDSLATLQAHLATAMCVNARQSCKHCTVAFPLMKIHMRYAILLATYACGKSHGRMIGQAYGKTITKMQSMASQVHINSLNLSLNFKPRFENLKPRFKNFKPRFERKSAHQFFKPGFEVSNRVFSWQNAH